MFLKFRFRMQRHSMTNSSTSGGRVHFLHVRKTGGTAIIEALRPLASTYKIVIHDHSTRLRDIPRDEKSVFFVRHPVTRFVSGFYSRLRRGLPRHHYEWTDAEAQAFRHFTNPNDLAEAITSEISGMATRAHEAMHGISHIKHTYKDWFLGPEEIRGRLDSILLLGVQEELNTDFERLKLLLQLPSGLSLPTDDIRTHRTPLEYDRALSPLAVHNLSRWFADDIRLYQYCLQVRAEQIQSEKLSLHKLSVAN